MARTDRVPFRIRALAFRIRRMPTGVRKFGRWWERLYRSIGGGGFDDDASIDEKWPAGVHGPVQSRRFGYRVLLDLQAWPERRTYFSGSYFQGDLEYLFPLVLRSGDQYLDIGTNIGMTSLMARAFIGPEGKGFAFEPNPETFVRLKRNFALNHTSNLEPVPFALSDREAEMELVLPTGQGNTGLGAPRGRSPGLGASFQGPDRDRPALPRASRSGEAEGHQDRRRRA